MGFDLPVMNRLRRSGRALSPASLFATGAPGVIYDPRDLSTMFQDSLGTTPVTAPGQVVGLRLDKSRALAAGPELVVNGNFASSSDWVLTAASSGTISISGGVLAVTRSGGYTAAGQSISFVSGKTYKILVRARRTSGTGTIAIVVRTGNTVGDTARFVAVLTPTGTFSEYSVIYVCANTEIGSLQLGVGTSDGVIEYDDATVREIAGNHATQATAGARLTYGIEPKTGTRNLLTYSEDFSNGIWGNTSVTVTSNTAIAPDGTTTADLIQFTGAPGASQAIFGYDTRTGAHTVSFYVKANTAGGVGQTVRIDSTGAGANAVVATLTAEWQRYSIAINPAGYFQYRVISSGGNTATELLLWGAQLETGAVATPYQKVVTAFEVTEAGVPTCHYCAYAGANSMATAAIDFTATDKLSVFSGVRKLSGAVSTFIEMAGGTDVVDGAISIFAPSGFGSDYYYSSKGTANAPLTTGAGTYIAPVNNIFTGLSDISGDSVRIRINGAQVAQTSANQGTGNYGNHPVYFGRRTGTSFPFTGRDYGIVIVGKATSAAEINITEAWLAANTPTVVL